MRRTYSGDSDNSMSDTLAQIGLGNFLHLGEDHGRHFLGGEYLFALFGADLHMGLIIFVDDLEGEELDITLDGLVCPVSANQSLGVKDGVLRVGGQLILGSVTNQTLALFFRECNIRWRDSVTLVIGNDFNASVLENTNTEIKSMANK